MIGFRRLRDYAAAMALLVLVSPVLRAQILPAPSDEPFIASEKRAGDALDRVLTLIQSGNEETRGDAPDRAVIAVPPPPFQWSASSDDAVVEYADRYWNGRVIELRTALWRLTRILPELERILTEAGVPSQFAAVVLVESGANPVALSPKAARGLWQFLPGTAEQYGLEVSGQRDDRVDMVKSTRAAARYLSDLYRTFGEWRLALAAYDAGEGALRQAVQRGHSSNFEVLSAQKLVPAETRNYVPAVLDAVNLLGQTMRP